MFFGTAAWKVPFAMRSVERQWIRHIDFHVSRWWASWFGASKLRHDFVTESRWEFMTRLDDTKKAACFRLESLDDNKSVSEKIGWYTISGWMFQIGYFFWEKEKYDHYDHLGWLRNPRTMMSTPKKYDKISGCLRTSSVGRGWWSQVRSFKSWVSCLQKLAERRGDTTAGSME